MTTIENFEANLTTWTQNQFPSMCSHTTFEIEDTSLWIQILSPARSFCSPKKDTCFYSLIPDSQIANPAQQKTKEKVIEIIKKILPSERYELHEKPSCSKLKVELEQFIDAEDYVGNHNFQANEFTITLTCINLPSQMFVNAYIKPCYQGDFSHSQQGIRQNSLAEVKATLKNVFPTQNYRLNISTS